MAYRFALRTDKEFEKVRDFIVARGISGWCVREVAGEANEHYHWYLETDLKIQALRIALVRAVPELRGNAGYSLSEVKDAEKYLRYMAKGESEGSGVSAAWRHGLVYTDEKLEELHEEYWTENRRLKKRKTGLVSDAVIDQCKAAAVPWSDRRKVTELYIRELISRDKPINLFQLKAAVNLVVCKLCPNDDALEDLLNSAQFNQ